MIPASEIKKLIKHRYPFVFIDRVLELEIGKHARGLKNISMGEPIFVGHFPEEPIFPGVLIIEAMAQLAAILNGCDNGNMGYLTSVYDAKFFKPVLPGDQLVICGDVVQKVKNLIRIKFVAHVAENRVARAELGFIVVPGTAGEGHE